MLTFFKMRKSICGLGMLWRFGAAGEADSSTDFASWRLERHVIGDECAPARVVPACYESDGMAASKHKVARHDWKTRDSGTKKQNAQHRKIVVGQG